MTLVCLATGHLAAQMSVKCAFHPYIYGKFSFYKELEVPQEEP
jgi:hypothetical protein